VHDTGWANMAGTYLAAEDLPLSPVPDRAPRLLVGGGSDRALRMAGRYADVLDLHGDPRHGKVAGATMEEARRGDVRRRALTTVEARPEPLRPVGSPAQMAEALHERHERYGWSASH
jgi:alkanesulfonate monooxygenase SsuD/methylene tetrahydromethanopterin reductase-like flavin-dependent oxidoreductase (luciferase family)